MPPPGTVKSRVPHVNLPSQFQPMMGSLPMKLRIGTAVVVVCLMNSNSWADNFIPTTGSQFWDIDGNWDSNMYPNSAGASATLPSPTDPLDPLTIDLGKEITIGTLTVNKSTTVGQTVDVTLTGSATNRLVFDGGGSLINAANSGSGLTTISAPVVLNSTLTIGQADNSELQLTQEISGGGGLNINRAGTGGGVTRTVVLGAANSYAGDTILTGSTGNSNKNYMLVRLDDAESIPSGSNILMHNAVIIGINYSGGADGDFTRGIGTTGNTFQNDSSSTATGWAAFGADRSINIFGNAVPSQVSYGSAVGVGLNIQNSLVLGHATADKTIDFRNPISLNGGGSNTSVRKFQINDGAAAIDAILSGSLTTNDTNNSRTDVEFDGDGTVSLTAANSYHSEYAPASPGPARTGSTVLSGNGLVVRLDNAQALSPNTNLTLTSSAILGLGTGNDSFTRPLGAPIDFLTGGAIEFTGPGGFAAYGGNKSVNLGGAGATVTWGIGSFVPDTKNLLLSEINSDGTLDFQNPIDLNGATRIVNVADGTAAVDAVLSGTLSGSGGGLQKNGDGTLQLPVANSYTGATIANGGSLRLDDAGALPSSSPLTIKNSGVLGLGNGNDTFTRNLGTGAGQVAWTDGASGGFAAYGGTKVVLLNNDSVNPLSWGSTPGFLVNSLVLSDSDADGTLDFQNPIDLNGSVRTVIVKGGSAVVDGKLSGVISGTGDSGINKSNPGTLELSAANTYAGTTTIGAGVLLLTNASSIPGGINGGNSANINFTGTNANNIAVLGLGQGDFTSGLGTGAGQVDLGTNAAFAAFYANRVVNLGGASAQVTWATGNFVSGLLRLGDVGADATVDFQNPIDLNGDVRTVSAANGTAAVMGILSGVISSASGSLTKTGSGTLKFTAANTYGGGTTVSAGRLLVSNTSGSGTGSGPVVVDAGTLGGTGSISGTVTVNAGGHIAPGESIESLAMGSLVLNAGSVLDMELGAPGSPGITSDLINVLNSGGLTLNGGSVALTDAGGLTAGTYTLIDYAGTLGGDVANLGTPTGPAGFSFALSNNTSNTSIDLQVTAVGLSGDFNNDGKVDAADYVSWRKNNGTNNALPNDNGLGTPITSAHYDLWRANFGNPPGSGSGSGLAGNQAVPEPATLVLICLIAPLIASRKFGWIRG